MTVNRSMAPVIDREYVEIYPVAWSPLTPADVGEIMRTRSFDGLDEITLYFHIPFCPELCAFCGFNKTSYREDTYARYVDMLEREIGLYRGHPDIESRTVRAVYFGGGTGSMLTPAHLERLVAAFHEVFTVAENYELTVESYPSTLPPSKLSAYADLGVNRLSIGIQSFVDRKLRAIGRHHSAAENERVLGDACAAGIEKVSIDVMYRVPNETMGELEFDLGKVLEYRPTNVACYSLILEGTNFERALPLLPDVDIETRMLERIRERLLGAGYQQWSTADYCEPGGMTKYNLNYWQAPQTLLLGLGAGAHSHYFGGHTWVNSYSLKDYLDAVESGTFPGSAGQPVSVEELMRRYMVMGVHCLKVDLDPFEPLFGLSAREYFAEELARLGELGWINDRGTWIEVTALGQLYVNNVAKTFFSPKCRGEGQPWSKNLRLAKPTRRVEISPHRA